MISKRAHSGLFVPFIIFCAVSADDAVIKSSLTFVIDDTGSMADEIRQVKEEVNIIFEKVLSSKASQIENFVIVTFNDPDARERVVTKDREAFKSALASINVYNGGDCPEYAMEGISLALRRSMPHSYLYIFTDASAKDFAKFGQVKSLAQKMQSQIVFILTGECFGRTGADYEVYHQLAEATSGQVFHMMKDDVKDILKYIEESITGIGSKLVDTKLPPGYDKKITYDVDAHTGDVLIALTGKSPIIGDVIGPDGSRPTTTHLISGKAEMAAAKVTGAKPGKHVVSVGSMSETHAVLSAKSTINFQLGFNVFKPKSSKDIVTRPPPKGNVYMGVKLLGTGVKLETVKILGMKGEVIEELKLELVDEKTQFYRTPSFSPPFTMFHVTINGYDIETKTPVTRRSPTPISRQDMATDPEVKVETAPVVTIDGDSLITLYIDDPLELTCKVHAYPEPDIIWQDRDYGIVMPAETNIVELPYDYVSVLKINNANKNTTYQCKASNHKGSDIKGVEVMAKRKFYFDVIDSPKEGKLVCKVDAYPSATIKWYKDAKPLSSSSHIEISKDQTVVTLKDMQPGMEGKFMCEARNDKERKVFYSNVEIFGVEKPVIDKSVAEIRVTEKTNGELSCRLLKGIPKPTITWSFRAPGIKKYLKQTGETIQLKNAQRDQTGLYICTAINVLGSDNHNMDVTVEYPPHIKSDVKEMKIVDGDEAKLTCDVDGVPAPTVYWTFNGINVTRTTRTQITADYSLIIKTTLDDTGNYACHAENKLGKDERNVFLQVYVPVSIEKPESDVIETLVGSGQLLNCRADGYPKPDIKWTFHKTRGAPGTDVTSPKHPSLALQSLQLNQQGFYTCLAENAISGSASITYEVKVLAPPVIENVYPSKLFEAVDGDMLLRIQCKATGSPTPTITWQKHGLNLAMGSDWYDMEADGTLLIKNIDRAAEGTYVCLAENSVGKDSDYYEVIVKDLLTVVPSKTLYVKEGETIDIKCDIPHTATDQLRWFKDGKKRIERDDIYLFRATRGDDGVYTCPTKLVVGFKPIFSTEVEEEIEFVQESTPASLNCQAYGEPSPTHATWTHDGVAMDNTDMSLILGMKLGATGIYECEVSNKFGSIRRSFNVTSRDCILDIKQSFVGKHPIMFSSSGGWSVFPIKEKYMIIPNKGYFYMRCPSGFVNPELSLYSNTMVTCERDNIVKIAGKPYNFADLQCNNEVRPDLEKTEKECFGDNTEYMKVGFWAQGNFFMEVYSVCFDKKNDVPLYTKHKLFPEHTNISSTSQWYSSSDIPAEEFEELYNCRRQLYDVGIALGKRITFYVLLLWKKTTRQSTGFASRYTSDSVFRV
ncbi:hypothetical protein SFRURICE_010166 [Spodoptera frugiperda]|nr:hypothetical protein SFRURICE_010166 [Spodoptera frugiperda]